MGRSWAWRAAWLAVLPALAAPGCGGGRLDRVPLGSWGGDHVRLDVGAESSRVEFDCAHGRIDGALRLDGESRFRQGGTFVREHGGPILEGEPEDVHPAAYSGQVDGHELTFELTLADEGQTLGPFTVRYGEPARLLKCLAAGAAS